MSHQNGWYYVPFVKSNPPGAKTKNLQELQMVGLPGGHTPPIGHFQVRVSCSLRCARCRRSTVCFANWGTPPGLTGQPQLYQHQPSEAPAQLPLATFVVAELSIHNTAPTVRAGNTIAGLGTVMGAPVNHSSRRTSERMPPSSHPCAVPRQTVTRTVAPTRPPKHNANHVCNPV